MIKYIAMLVVSSPVMAATTFDTDIKPIFKQKCVMCHTQLKNYDYVKMNAAKIITNRKMTEFLTEEEQTLIEKWLKAGMPK